MSIKQISVFLENKPGTLREMTDLLSRHNVDLRALSLAETKDFGIARLIADDVLGAMNVLREGGFIAKLTPVLAYEVPDEPGGLTRLLDKFSEAGVNIEYMYSFLGSAGEKKAYMLFRATDTEKAEADLARLGLKSALQENFD